MGHGQRSNLSISCQANAPCSTVESNPIRRCAHAASISEEMAKRGRVAGRLFRVSVTVRNQRGHVYSGRSARPLTKFPHYAPRSRPTTAHDTSNSRRHAKASHRPASMVDAARRVRSNSFNRHRLESGYRVIASLPFAGTSGRKPTICVREALTPTANDLI